MRQCGECTLCCVVTAVPELRKPERVRCHACGKGCCTIYNERPPSCVTFRCAWLQGDMPEEMRPDKIHVMVEKLPDVPVVIALVEPGYNGKWLTDEVNFVLQTIYQEAGVSVVSGKSALLAPGATDSSVMKDMRSAARSMGVA